MGLTFCLSQTKPALSRTPREDVRDALANAGIVVAKLDVHNQELFRQVNRTIVDLMLSDIIEGIKLFRREFVGKLRLQIMFIEVNKNFAREIVQTASCLLPDEVQLNAPLRPYLVKPLTSSQMAYIKCAFSNFICPVVAVYEVPRPEVKPLNL